MKDEYYLIKEAAAKIGVESHVLRYWEEELKMEIRRNEMGHRYYTERDIEIFTRVRDLKEKGLQLKAIRSYLEKRREQISASEKTEDIVETVSGENGQPSRDLKKDRIQKPGRQAGSEAQNRETAKRAEPETQNRETAKQAGPEAQNRETARQAEPEAQNREAAGQAGPEIRNREAAGQAGTEPRNRDAERHPEAVTREKEPERASGKEVQPMDVREETEGQSRVTGRSDDAGNPTGVSGESADRRVDKELVPARTGVLSNEEKLQQFQQIMSRILSGAIQENNELIGETAGRHAADAVVNTLQGMTKEQEARAEARYQKLDQTLREIQKARQEAAAANMRPVDRRRQKRLKRKNPQAYFGESPQ